MSTSKRIGVILFIIAIVGACVLAYYRTRPGPLAYDDKASVS